MLKAFGLIAFLSAGVFAVALIVLMVGYSWQPSGQETKQQYSAENKQEHHNRESEKPFWQKVTSDPVAAFTLWLVIFTAVLGASSVFQLVSLNRSEITPAKAAKAAEDSAEISKDALVSVQRAFVSVSTFETNVINQEIRIQ